MGSNICRRNRSGFAGADAAYAWRRLRPDVHFSLGKSRSGSRYRGYCRHCLADVYPNCGVRNGGVYLSGRLRTKWVDTHTNEIYFRDTAHGFLTWAVALLVSAVLLTTTVSSLIGGSAKVIGSVAGGATATAMSNAGDESSVLSKSSMEYFTRSLFRSTASAPADNGGLPANSSGNDAMAMNQPVPPKAESPAQLAEVTGIFANSIYTGALPQEDLTYVAQLVSQNTGISQQEAEQRVQAVYDKAQANLKEAKNKAQQAADAARKATSYVTLWSFISLLIGAFVASLCATYGGRQRGL